MRKAAYLIPIRLEDMIFLIQYLGLGEAYSLQDGTEPDGVAPRSAPRWSDITRAHPEFFRLTAANASTLSLRYFLREGPGNPAPLAAELVQTLLQNAMTLHERQAKRVEVWRGRVTMIAAIIAAVAGVIGLFVKK